jgi:hypothetical protein
LGHIAFSNGRMLCALCKGDSYAGLDGSRQFISYGGIYRFDGTELEVVVDVASDPDRIGTRQVRALVMMGEEMQLRPPARLYGGSLQQREVIWERVWRPQDDNRAEAHQLRIVVAGD